MSLLYLIGTDHFDIDGAGRLETLLEFINPDCIAVEVDEARARKAEENYSGLQNIKGDPSKLERYLSDAEKLGLNLETVNALFFPERVGYWYEYLVPKLYWEPKGVKVVPADAVRSIESFVPGMIASANEDQIRLLRMSQGELRQHSKVSYALESVEEYYQSLMAEEIKLAQERGIGMENAELNNTLEAIRATTKRLMIDFAASSDVCVEQNLRQLCGSSYARIAHVGGIFHTSTYPFGEKNLIDRLADLNPVRMKLSDADNLPQIQRV